MARRATESTSDACRLYAQRTDFNAGLEHFRFSIAPAFDPLLSHQRTFSSAAGQVLLNAPAWRDHEDPDAKPTERRFRFSQQDSIAGLVRQGHRHFLTGVKPQIADDS